MSSSVTARGYGFAPVIWKVRTGAAETELLLWVTETALPAATGGPSELARES
jgi:hypothetical protein